MPGQDSKSKSAARWGDLQTRAISTLLLVPLALLLLGLGGVWWQCWCALLGVGIASEWLRLCGYSMLRPAGLSMLALFALLWGALMFGLAPIALILAICAAVVILILINPWLGLGLVYIGLSVWALSWLRMQAQGWANVVFLLPVVWASDIGAYVTGRVLGGPKMAPRVSPGKTWSGAVGGVIAAVLVGASIAEGLSGLFARAVLVAGVLAVISQIGDLGESGAKRHFGVKDSGNLIPGHGGLFDRLDGVMAAGLAAIGFALYAGIDQYLWR